MITLTETSLPTIDRTDVSRDKLASFKTESEFTGLAVDLLIEVGSYSCIAANIMGDKERWDRNQAAIGGNIVRLYKLISATLDQTVQLRQEIVFILTRLIFEANVSIRYLIKNFSPDIIYSYVEHSLRHERKLRDLVVENIKNRGQSIPIEDRILNSLNRAAAVAQITLDDIDPKKRAPWGGKDLYRKAEDVELDQAYLAAMGGASHSVHGSWHEVYAHHLKWDEETGFSPQLEWQHPRPHPHFAMALITVDTLCWYFDFICGASSAKLFHDRLDDLRSRIVLANEGHEEYLSDKKWPAI